MANLNPMGEVVLRINSIPLELSVLTPKQEFESIILNPAYIESAQETIRNGNRIVIIRMCSGDTHEIWDGKRDVRQKILEVSGQ